MWLGVSPPPEERTVADIGFSDANTFSSGVFFYGSKAECPKHGEVSGDFRCFVTSDPSYTTPKICPKCYVDWVTANVTAVSASPLQGEARG